VSDKVCHVFSRGHTVNPNLCRVSSTRSWQPPYHASRSFDVSPSSDIRHTSSTLSCVFTGHKWQSDHLVDQKVVRSTSEWYLVAISELTVNPLLVGLVVFVWGLQPFRRLRVVGSGYFCWNSSLTLANSKVTLLFFLIMGLIVDIYDVYSGLLFLGWMSIIFTRSCYGVASQSCFIHHGELDPIMHTRYLPCALSWPKEIPPCEDGACLRPAFAPIGVPAYVAIIQWLPTRAGSLAKIKTKNTDSIRLLPYDTVVPDT
jgi:hypothetical protein